MTDHIVTLRRVGIASIVFVALLLIGILFIGKEEPKKGYCGHSVDYCNGYLEGMIHQNDLWLEALRRLNSSK